MTPETFNNKRIIWESKERQAILICTFFLFAVAAIWTKQNSPAIVVWTQIVCCGACGLSLLIRALNPNNIFVAPNSPLARQIFAEYEKEHEDLDLFTHTFLGFSIENRHGSRFYKWADIETIFAYKKAGEIRMDIFTNDNAVWRLTQGNSGWHLFQQRLSENISSITTAWEDDIPVFAFNTRPALLFDRKSRMVEEVEADCYEPAH